MHCIHSSFNLLRCLDISIVSRYQTRCLTESIKEWARESAGEWVTGQRTLATIKNSLTSSYSRALINRCRFKTWSMERSGGSKDENKRSPGRGRPTGVKESKKRAAAGAERALGRPPGIEESQKRAGAGAERAPGAGRPPGIKESKSRAAGAGGSNHQLPQTKSKKMVEEGWLMHAQGNYKEALALFTEATVVDSNNGHAFLSVSKLQWKLRYISTNGDISNDEMQRCLSSAEESQRLGWEGAEDQVMYLRLMGPRGRGAILPEYLPGLLIYYEAQTRKPTTDLAAASVTYQHYGLVLFEAKQLELAEIANQKSAELNPANFSVLHNQGILMRGLGRIPEAIEHVQACLRLRPAFDPARRLLEKLQLARESSAVVVDSLVAEDGYATSAQHDVQMLGEEIDFEAEVGYLQFCSIKN